MGGIRRSLSPNGGRSSHPFGEVQAEVALYTVDSRAPREARRNQPSNDPLPHRFDRTTGRTIRKQGGICAILWRQLAYLVVDMQHTVWSEGPVMASGRSLCDA